MYERKLSRVKVHNTLYAEYVSIFLTPKREFDTKKEPSRGGVVSTNLSNVWFVLFGG